MDQTTNEPRKVNLTPLAEEFSLKLEQRLTELLGGRDFILLVHGEPVASAITNLQEAEECKAMLNRASDQLTEWKKVNPTTDDTERIPSNPSESTAKLG